MLLPREGIPVTWPNDEHIKNLRDVFQGTPSDKKTRKMIPRPLDHNYDTSSIS
jgi:hypothetical protein